MLTLEQWASPKNKRHHSSYNEYVAAHCAKMHGRELCRLARLPKAKPVNQIKLILTGRQPALEALFAARARLHESSGNG